MRFLDAQLFNGGLLIIIDGSRTEMFGAKTAVARALGCEVHLATPGMMNGVRNARRKPGESVPRTPRHHRYARGEASRPGARHRPPAWGDVGRARVPRDTRAAGADLLDARRHERRRDRSQRLPVGVEGRSRTGAAAGVPIAGTRSTMGGLNMRSFALIEGDRATMLHVRHDGDVTVFDRGRESPIRFRIAMHVDGDTT